MILLLKFNVESKTYILYELIVHRHKLSILMIIAYR